MFSQDHTRSHKGQRSKLVSCFTLHFHKFKYNQSKLSTVNWECFSEAENDSCSLTLTEKQLGIVINLNQVNYPAIGNTV